MASWLLCSIPKLCGEKAEAVIHQPSLCAHRMTIAVELAKSCDYAIRGLLCLAERPDPFEPVLLRDIAEQARAPEPFMSKVFQSLRASHVVRSHRGRDRGYSLARPPQDISLYDVILAMQGPAALQSIAPSVSGRGGENAFLRAWEQIEQQVVDALKRNTLQTMLQTSVEGNA